MLISTRKKLKEFINKLGLDKTIIFTITSRIWTASAGIITIFFLTNYINIETQGYYYTFFSILALQVFAELGLTYAIIQITSHEMAKLSWQDNCKVTGSHESKYRLKTILKFTLKWFFYAALAMNLILIPVGIALFESVNDNKLEVINTTLPWILLVVCASINMIISSIISFIEGCGKTEDVAIFRLIQNTMGSCCLWLLLANDGNLYAIFASSLMTLIIGISWLLVKYRLFLKDLLLFESNNIELDWRKEIWPFQWRIAISWISGYLSIQIFNPILLSTQGPVVAAQMGMTLQIIGALNGIAITWITTKAPIYGKLIAQNEFAKLNKIFNTGITQSIILLIIANIILLTIVGNLKFIAPELIERILPFKLITCLCLASLANHISGAQGAYLRAFKKDPLMYLSVFSGLSISIFSLIFIPKYGVQAAVVLHMLVAVIFGLFFGSIIYKLKKIEYTNAR